MDKNQLEDDYLRAKSRLLLLDYDGVLAPIMPLPEQAIPGEKVKRVLGKLLSDPHNTCVVISGRPRRTLEEWLGNLPLAFAAEHGFWRREPGGEWVPAMPVQAAWKREVRAVMERAASELEKSFVEEKTAAVAFHYRNSLESAAEKTTSKLIERLAPVVAEASLRLLEGKKVIEVIPADVDKGRAAGYWLEKEKWDFILAVGDDVTDEALFSAVPDGAYSIKIGMPPTAARAVIPSQPEFMRLLESLAGL